jgi:hypothetical protein
VLNHTRNIQSKDLERMPYPHWVRPDVKNEVVTIVETMVSDALEGARFDRPSPEILKLDEMFSALPATRSAAP